MTHVDVLVEETALNRANTVQTPTTDALSENPGPLEQEPLHNNSSHVARCLFLSQDRADHNFHSERIMPANVKPHKAELVTIEEACQALER